MFKHIPGRRKALRALRASSEVIGKAATPLYTAGCAAGRESGKHVESSGKAPSERICYATAMHSMPIFQGSSSLVRRYILCLSMAVAASSTPLIASAQLLSPAASAPIAGNLTLVSEYRLRGIDQSFGQPALQGGFDYSHASGAYLGNWNSNVNQGRYPGSSLEMDFYGGYKRAFGDFGADVGFIYYSYPGSDPKIDNKELYIGGGWKFLSAKFFYAIDDYFSRKGSRGESTNGTTYLDLAANYDLGNSWGVVAHYGHLNFKRVDNGSYSDWKLGATKDLSGWILSAAYVGTNARGDCGRREPYCFTNGAGKSRDAGRSTVLVSVGKSF